MRNMQGFDAKPVHWGFYVGINHFDFSRSPTREGTISGLGNRVTTLPSKGLVGDAHLYKNLSLRLEPAVHYARKDLSFRDVKDRYTTYKLKSEYLNPCC